MILTLFKVESIDVFSRASVSGELHCDRMIKAFGTPAGALRQFEAGEINLLFNGDRIRGKNRFVVVYLKMNLSKVGRKSARYTKMEVVSDLFKSNVIKSIKDSRTLANIRGFGSTSRAVVVCGWERPSLIRIWASVQSSLIKLDKKRGNPRALVQTRIGMSIGAQTTRAIQKYRK